MQHHETRWRVTAKAVELRQRAHALPQLLHGLECATVTNLAAHAQLATCIMYKSICKTKSITLRMAMKLLQFEARQRNLMFHCPSYRIAAWCWIRLVQHWSNAEW
jgi:hypothetical protein